MKKRLSIYDKEIVLDLLNNMIGATEKILYRNKDIQSIDDNSLMLLDSLCMQLIAIGEAVKKIDKETDKKLLRLILKSLSVRLQVCVMFFLITILI